MVRVCLMEGGGSSKDAPPRAHGCHSQLLQVPVCQQVDGRHAQLCLHQHQDAVQKPQHSV